MKRYILTLILVSLLLISLTSTVFAQDGPALNENNCAGAITSSLAAPGFGHLVASFAHAQLVDNFGLASCGDNPRNNP